MKQIFMIGLGGFLGTIARYLLYLTTAKWTETFQAGILLANLLGCFIIGLVIGLLSYRTYQPIYGFLAIGFCGGFTTFSSFALDGVKLLKQGLWIPFTGYLLVSVAGGILFCLLGVWLGNKLT